MDDSSADAGSRVGLDDISFDDANDVCGDDKLRSREATRRVDCPAPRWTKDATGR